jgi:1-deoxy-D-xylulose-5-phosphate synthase
MLTGRKDRLSTIRQYGGLSGFAKRGESDTDVFGAGHASTAISASLGFANARDLTGEDHHVIAVVGDGALTGGLAFEGLNNAGAQKKNLLVILNDNSMSIAKNVGAISKYLTSVLADESYNKLKADVWEFISKLKRAERIKKTVSFFESQLKAMLVPGVIFEKLGFRYFGPIDGHDLPLLIKTLGQIKDLPGPRMLHIVTMKGKGYEPAEKDAVKYHGVKSAFDKVDKSPPKPPGLPAWTKVFSKTMIEYAEHEPKMVAITAAMPSGTGLDAFEEIYPNRFYDVGIAEQHAVCFAAGLAAGGAKPVCAIYSTFLQRAYDQIIHDVALQKLPVVFCLDRAGLVGEDGPTHHGLFDIAYLRAVPNMTICVPADGDELRAMLAYALKQRSGPVAMRYPRGSIPYELGTHEINLEWGKWQVITGGEDVAVIACGTMVAPGREVVAKLAEEGLGASLINARFVKPLDEATLEEIGDRFGQIVTIEEGTANGGICSAVTDFLVGSGYRGRILKLAVPDRFIQHGSRALLLKEVGLDADGIYRSIRSWLKPRRSILRALSLKRNERKSEPEIVDRARQIEHAADEQKKS